MEKKNFKKYFSQTKKLLFTGISVIIAGIIVYLLNEYWLHTYDLYQAAWLIMVAGVVVIICHFTIRIRDGAVDEYSVGFHKELEKELEEFINESEKNKKFNRVFDYTSGAYELWDKDIKNLVIGSDNTPRCEQYGGGALTCTADTVYAVAGSLNLITGDINTTRFSASLSEITEAKIIEKSYTKVIKKKTKFIECFAVELNTDNAKVSFAIHSDAMTDDAVDKINRMAESKRK